MPKRSRFASGKRQSKSSTDAHSASSAATTADPPLDSSSPLHALPPAPTSRVAPASPFASARLLRARPAFLQPHHVAFFAVYASIIAWGVSEFDGDAAKLTAHMVALPCAVCMHVFMVLMTFWSVKASSMLQYSKQSDVGNATHVMLVEETSGKSIVCQVKKEDGEYHCMHRERKFTFNHSTSSFDPLDFPIDLSFRHYMSSRGHSDESLISATRKFGTNELHIPLPHWKELYKQHAVQPFFVFQIFCVLLWMMDEYWQYSLVTLALLLFVEYFLVLTRLGNLSSLRDMTPPPHTVNVHRNGRWRRIDATALVPGDVVSMARRHGAEVAAPADVLLISGTCVVNESILTGESTPQMKESISGCDPEAFLSLDAHRSLHIINGGTSIVQTSPPKRKIAGVLSSPDGGCVAYVLTTRFETSQGRLMRTILDSTTATTANTAETLGFIAFMLVFALGASAYVLFHGLADEARSRYKLALNCVMILTSVVPPELPMELTIAVNNSLKALKQLGVFCTEPFRIPFAGRVDVCCFDKTGTLTENEIVMVGVAGQRPPPHVVEPLDVSDEAAYILAGCHSVVPIDGDLVGDFTELAALKGIQWACKGDSSHATKGSRKGQSVRVIQRYHFSSELKRMSCIVSLDHRRDLPRRVVCKGAPEVMEGLFRTHPSGGDGDGGLPHWYADTYRHFGRMGMRVLALGWRPLSAEEEADGSLQSICSLPRETVERDLRFAGFLVLESVLKAHSASTVEALHRAGHTCVMITGDNALTACEVARTVGITHKDRQVVIFRPSKNVWETLDRSHTIAHNLEAFKAPTGDLMLHHELVVDGKGLEALQDTSAKVCLRHVAPHVRVWARCSPKQKEAIIGALKSTGHTTLMCGDGTNDVGALKAAHVGVALLNVDESIDAKNTPTAHPQAASKATHRGGAPPQTRTRKSKSHKQRLKESTARSRGASSSAAGAGAGGMASLMDQLKDETGVAKLGDASIASPFTAKSSTIHPVQAILRQGRCTLVTTYQMFMILGVNSLINAYFLSVMFLDGVKIGDQQAWLPSLFIVFCYMCVTMAKPLDALSTKRPHRRLFCLEHLLALFGQSAIHLACLIGVVGQAQALMAAQGAADDVPQVDGEFAPCLVNTGAFILSLWMQLVTVLVNYRGHPFTESLMENTKLLCCVCAGLAVVVVCVTEAVPPLNDALELVPMPTPYRMMLQCVCLADVLAAFAWQRTCAALFQERARAE